MIETVSDTHKSTDFIEFFKKLDAAYPVELIDRIHQYFVEVNADPGDLSLEVQMDEVAIL